MLMRYSYVAAWSVIGGTALPAGTPELELHRSSDCRFILTSDPQGLLVDVDRGAALGGLLLKGLFNAQRLEDVSTSLQSGISEINAARNRTTASYPVLVFEGSGQTEASIKEPTRDTGNYIIAFDAVDKQKIKEKHQPKIDSMKLALALESAFQTSFAKIADGVFLTNNDGKIIYSLNFSGTAQMTAAAGLRQDGQARIAARYLTLNGANDLASVKRLFAQLSMQGADELSAFLSGWNALEILIAKSFASHEDAFLETLANGPQPNLREEFLKRLKEVMKDKYRLVDRFIAVTSIIFATSPEQEVDKDLQKFRDLKNLRDGIFHGKDFDKNALPVAMLEAFLRKYITAQLSSLSDQTSVAP